MDHKKTKLIVLLGPTASGKSDLAITLARKFGGEIISADSRQVYCGMDIGTGKVTKRELRLVPHHLLDVADPKRDFSVARFQRLGRKAIADIARRGKLPIIAGGTGFYIDALVYGTKLPDVKPDKKLRAKLEKHSAEQLFAQLKKLDPARATSIDPHNKRRLVRALEIVLATGKPVPVASRESSYDVLWLGITWPKEELGRRIAVRLAKRFKQGMIAEIRLLRAHGVSFKRLECFGLEYRWIAMYLQGKTSLSEAKAGLQRAIVQYAKRQMTWFKRNKDIRWITNENQALGLAREFVA